ncbi:MAG: T9SS type A sorting domain-containing protein [Bacteroidota bacterium]
MIKKSKTKIRIKKKTAIKAFILITVFICESALSQQFGNLVNMGQIESDEIREASGIAASSKNPGVLWTFNDSGGKNSVYAFDSLGNHLGSFSLVGSRNRDWEDIAIGPGPIEGEHYIYVGDIGDNSIQYNEKYIYRVSEPFVYVGQVPVDTALYDVERLVFQYPNGNRNAETLMIDVLTKDLYIVSKEDQTIVYRSAWPYTFYPEPTLNVDTLETVVSLSLSRKALGGDISPDGKEILIKDRTHMYYWKKDDTQSIGEALEENPELVPYITEPQGEAVCWAGDLSGYFTLSEGLHPYLYFYPRLTTSITTDNANCPSKFKLDQNYPNPFNPSTTISYQLPESDKVEVAIFNISGQYITTLVNKEQAVGNYLVQWNGRDDKGLKVTSGIYFYRLKTESLISTKKMMLLQ